MNETIYSKNSDLEFEFEGQGLKNKIDDKNSDLFTLVIKIQLLNFDLADISLFINKFLTYLLIIFLKILN